MRYQTPKTCLQLWEAEKYSNPALTTEQFALRLAMPHEVFLAKLEEARYVFSKRHPPVQVGAITTFELDALEDGWQQWFLLQSDNHHDAMLCNRELETEHLDEAIAIIRAFLLARA